MKRGLATRVFSLWIVSQTWGFVPFGGAGITGYLVLPRFCLRCFTRYQLKLLFPPSRRPSLQLCGDKQKDEKGKGVYWRFSEPGIGLVISLPCFYRGACTLSKERRGGSKKPRRASWKMKAVRNSGSNIWIQRYSFPCIKSILYFTSSCFMSW